MKTWKLLLAGLALASLLAGCAGSAVRTARAPDVALNARWVLLPAVNNTETPQAGGRLDSITASLLRVRGVPVTLYPAAQAGDGLFETADRRSQESALAWARKQGLQYAVYGAVDEWRYKVGLDGEPAAGISLNIVDVASGQVIWSGSGARTGWSREAVSAVAQDLVDELLSSALNRAK